MSLEPSSSIHKSWVKIGFLQEKKIFLVLPFCTLKLAASGLVSLGCEPCNIWEIDFSKMQNQILVLFAFYASFFFFFYCSNLCHNICYNNLFYSIHKFVDWLIWKLDLRLFFKKIWVFRPKQPLYISQRCIYQIELMSIERRLNQP